MSTTLNEQPPNPTVLQGLEQTPALEILTHADFSNFHNSGATIKIKTPLVKNSQEALFAVCTNGFVPNAALAGGVIGRMLANFFPLQPFPNSFSDEISNVIGKIQRIPLCFNTFLFVSIKEKQISILDFLLTQLRPVISKLPNFLMFKDTFILIKKNIQAFVL